VATFTKNIYLFLVLIFLSCQNPTQKVQNQATNPNVIIIYMDDLGYGDISSYNKGKLKTPNIDKLANEGLKFLNGYSSSATCTPSRYALLTGTYPWRNPRAKIITGGSLIIDTTEMTLPKLFKIKGYKTGIVGKWHLGLGKDKINYNTVISPGPNEVGFDYSYILADTQDRVPCVYIKNGRVAGLDSNDPINVNFDNNDYGLPTGLRNPELTTMKWHHGHNGSIVNEIPRIGFMEGGYKARWIDEDMADNFLNKAKKYINENKNNQFFLFYSLQQPHVPRTPNPRFVGKSGMGPRGDVIVEADWCVGQLYKTLAENNLLENTLIIFSSDNGPVLNDGYFDAAVEMLGEHTPSGGLRGGKYSLFEAGTRVPFIVHWKDKIKAGVSEQIISQIDLFNSISKMIGSDIRTKDGKDLSNLILNNAGEGRNELVIEAMGKTAYRNKEWVMIPPYKGRKIAKNVQIELGNSADYMLFDLERDPYQKNNLAKKKPEKLKFMISSFEKIKKY
jgi:arylsulfatase A-like enzyme